MKQVHVECDPDELLVSKLGFSRKLITHHQGRSRIFYAISKTNHQLAMVDEDPESGRSSYEKALQFIEEFDGIKYYKDHSDNKIIILKGRLEDWITNVCKKDKLKLSAFGLPENPNELHDVINQRLLHFGKLIDNLIENDNTALLRLKSWLS
jgi:deoxyribodipyrimidine photolyase-like uncharacterized protein